MIEIRRVKTAENEEFLRLLCHTFSIDYTRAQMFFNQPSFTDLQRKWALFEEGHLRSILTTVPLVFGWGQAIGIAGVATVDSERGRGLGGTLVNEVMRQAAENGYTACYLFATRVDLYSRLGFEVLDTVIRSPFSNQDTHHLPKPASEQDVRAMYTAWAASDPNRLRRDDRRWKYWKLTNRVCTPMPGGYYCLEGGVVREMIAGRGEASQVRLPNGTDWLGLSSVAASLGIPGTADDSVELLLMGRGGQGIPQMFMTDQF